MYKKIELSRNPQEKLRVYLEEDLTEVIEQNAALRKEEQKSDWGRHVATIPNIISIKWLQEEWERGHDIRWNSEEWNQLVAKKLKDPDWAFLRTDGPSHNMGWRK